jgi:group II intron reverse transcriptase/maturase
MRNAETVLGIIHDRGRRGLPLEDVYRQLVNPDLFLLAYGRIARNAGAMTPGVTAETVDGMSLAKIGRIIDALRRETYRWTPVRRVYIEKKRSTKKRPLGIPIWSDKLLQEVMRLVLEAYYEPQFSPASHGFRPARGCHTALDEIYHRWVGTKWFVEGDIARCFDSLDHAVLEAILSEKIHDGRFLRLIRNLLRAGYLEAWRHNATLSGSPQGSVLSPVLSNVYLDRLDRFVETTVLPKYNRGDRRRLNPAWCRLRDKAKQLEKAGDWHEADRLRHRMKQVPCLNPMDPAYRRLRYIRYADDWLLGFSGPRCEAEEIKREVGAFLRDELKLELSETKTLITHARSQAARFLGYHIVVLHDDRKRDQRGHRSINGQIGLQVPPDVVRETCARYLCHGEPMHRSELVHDSVFSIVVQYQREYRGVVEYYRRAYDLHRLNRLKWTMERSLTRTLALKLRTSVSRVYRRFGATLQTDRGPCVGLQVEVERGEGKKPLMARWGGITLARGTKAVLDDAPLRICGPRTELERRLLANTCELCGSQEDIQVHHVRALKDLLRKGRAARPYWVEIMAARQRKTLVTCRACHADIHAGRSVRRAPAVVLDDTGEPGAPKGARPVRGEADGKVPATATRQPPTPHRGRLRMRSRCPTLLGRDA